MSKFSERVKDMRLERNLSLRQLSKLSDISPSALHSYEIGKREASHRSLEALSDIFNCDIDYLLGRTDVRNSVANKYGFNSLYEAHKAGIDIQLFGEKETSPISEPLLTEEEKKWMEIYHRLSNETREMLITSLDELDTLTLEQQQLVLDLIRVALKNRI